MATGPSRPIGKRLLRRVGILGRTADFGRAMGATGYAPSAAIHIRCLKSWFIRLDVSEKRLDQPRGVVDGRSNGGPPPTPALWSKGESGTWHGAAMGSWRPRAGWYL